MRSLDECIKYIKDMGNTYTAVGDIRSGEVPEFGIEPYKESNHE